MERASNASKSLWHETGKDKKGKNIGKKKIKRDTDRNVEGNGNRGKPFSFLSIDCTAARAVSPSFSSFFFFVPWNEIHVAWLTTMTNESGQVESWLIERESGSNENASNSNILACQKMVQWLSFSFIRSFYFWFPFLFVRSFFFPFLLIAL